MRTENTHMVAPSHMSPVIPMGNLKGKRRGGEEKGKVPRSGNANEVNGEIYIPDDEENCKPKEY